MRVHFIHFPAASPLWVACLRCALLICLCGVSLAGVQTRGRDDTPPPPRLSAAPEYRIALDVDYRAATYNGRLDIKVTNQTKDNLEHIAFHLYPNVGLRERDEPWLSVGAARVEGRQAVFQTRGNGALIRVQLPGKIAPGRELSLSLDFRGRLPRVQREETSLLAHFLSEVSDATGNDTPPRDARDIFFTSEQGMLLGWFYPVLAVRKSDPGDSELAAGVGGVVTAEIAGYEVTVNVDPAVTVIGSVAGEVRETRAGQQTLAQHMFRGAALRGFALALAEKLDSREKRDGGVRVVSWFRPGDAAVGERMLDIAVRALAVYRRAFGPYPGDLINVVEMPLPAGYSGVEFTGLTALAQAYYIDFESDEASRLPAVVREQEDVIESALEFTLAHCLAHQWWGNVVGSDPRRYPWLDEALANYSAAWYHEAAYGKVAGAEVVEKQLRGAWQAWRMLGGADQEVDKPANDYHSAMQYAAIAQAKSALMLVELRTALGDARFFAALREYYLDNRFRIVSPEQFRQQMTQAGDNPQQIREIFQRWLKEKNGDRDIGAPELTLMSAQGSGKRAWGRFFARIGRAAARPF
ncbi:MAG: M1 family aminopeptidase [Blastocatellia bacterium]